LGIHPGREPFGHISLYGHDQGLCPDHEVDSYSGFRNNWDAAGRRPPTGLAGLIREQGIIDVHVAGLARDVCVKWTAEDAADLGYRNGLSDGQTIPLERRVYDHRADVGLCDSEVGKRPGPVAELLI
jgi:nicotinamidase/pyrazinamidase